MGPGHVLSQAVRRQSTTKHHVALTSGSLALDPPHPDWRALVHKTWPLPKESPPLLFGRFWAIIRAWVPPAQLLRPQAPDALRRCLPRHD